MAYIRVDTREKDNDYILAGFKSGRISFKQEKLDEGDYEASDNPNCVIDLKNGIAEVQKNIAGNKNERERFLNEIVRCQTKGKKLIVLIREPKIYALGGVQYWKSPTSWQFNKKTKKWENKPNTKVSGKFIMKVMERYRDEYGIEWRFCKPEESARTIVYLLKKNGGNIGYGK